MLVFRAQHSLFYVCVVILDYAVVILYHVQGSPNFPTSWTDVGALQFGMCMYIYLQHCINLDTMDAYIFCFFTTALWSRAATVPLLGANALTAMSVLSSSFGTFPSEWYFRCLCIH